MEYILYTAIVMFMVVFFIFFIIEVIIRINEQLPKLGATLIELWLAYHTAQAEASKRRWE